jgi:hypothetical protein
VSRALRRALLPLSLCALAFAQAAPAAPPYAGKPFEDPAYKAGAQRIPGIVQAALYDTGGEGVAYHDTDAVNHGSGELNAEALHQRPHASAYVWGFRKDEGVDVSYVKDFADLNHPNSVSPLVNQLYIGWTEDGEWVNYTVEVEAAGRYVVRALYSNEANAVSFDADGRAAGECRLPVPTGHWHTWNYAQIGTVTFPKAGRQVLTFHYGKGNNFAFFAFERAQ